MHGVQLNHSEMSRAGHARAGWRGVVICVALCAFAGTDRPALAQVYANGTRQHDVHEFNPSQARWQCRSNDSPIANAGDDQTTWVGEEVEFDASASYDPEGSALTFHWDFGDGTSASGVQATHAYLAPGTYAVTLTVTDRCGEQNLDTALIDVEEEPESDGFFASFEVSSDPVDIKVPVTFSADASEAYVMMYLWSFSDGGSGYGRNVTRVFNTAGNHTATLTVVAYDGASLSAQLPITVLPGLTLIAAVTDSVVSTPRGFAVVHDTAWATGDVQGIATADVTVPGAPVPINEATLVGAPWHIDANEDLVAVAAAWGGVYFFNANTPDALTPLGRFDTYADDGSSAYHVCLHGDLVYVACDTELKVLDVTDPTTPLQIGTWNEFGGVLQVNKVANRLYAYDPDLRGFYILDISNPASPFRVGSIGTLGRPEQVSVAGNLLAAAEGPSGLQIFDVSNPDAPVLRATRAYSGGGATGVAFRGTGLLYVAAGSRVEKFNLANPASPALIQWVSVGALTYEMVYLPTCNHLFASISQGVTAVFRP